MMSPASCAKPGGSSPILRSAARLGAAARATVEREYSWDVLGVKLRRQYHRAIARRKGHLPASAPA